MAFFTMEMTHGILSRPGAKVFASSDRLGWSDVYASTQFEHPYEATFEGCDAHLLVIHRDSRVRVTRYLDGARADRVIGVGGMFLMPATRGFAVELAGLLNTIHIYLQPGLVRMAAQDICRDDPAKVELVPRLGDQDPLIEQLALALAGCLEDRQPGSWHANALAMALAGRLVSHHSTARLSPATSNCGLSPRTMRRVQDLIQDRLDQPISVKDLADAAVLSPIHFSRQFKRTTGNSPHQYVMDARVDMAKRLLATTMPIAEIAFRCGFSHQEHLTRIFGRRVGATPAAYRRSLCN